MSHPTPCLIRDGLFFAPISHVKIDPILGRRASHEGTFRLYAPEAAQLNVMDGDCVLDAGNGLKLRIGIRAKHTKSNVPFADFEFLGILGI